MTGRVDVSYKAGFVVCRHSGTEPESGAVVPGTHCRIRCTKVNTYTQVEPGVLEVHVDGVEEPFELIGTVSALEKVLSRDDLRLKRGADTAVDEG